MASRYMINGGSDHTSGLTELEQILRTLELGTTIIKFFPKRRPEKKTFFIKLETRQVIWQRVSVERQDIACKNDYEGVGKNYCCLISLLL